MNGTGDHTRGPLFRVWPLLVPCVLLFLKLVIIMGNCAFLGHAAATELACYDRNQLPADVGIESCVMPCGFSAAPSSESSRSTAPNFGRPGCFADMASSMGSPMTCRPRRSTRTRSSCTWANIDSTCRSSDSEDFRTYNRYFSCDILLVVTTTPTRPLLMRFPDAPVLHRRAAARAEQHPRPSCGAAHRSRARARPSTPQAQPETRGGPRS